MILFCAVDISAEIIVHLHKVQKNYAWVSAVLSPLYPSFDCSSARKRRNRGRKDRGRLITKGMIERVVSSVFVYNHTITPPGIFNIYLSIFHLLSICLSIWRNFLYFSFLFHHIVPVYECVWRMKIEFKIFQLSFLLDENLFSL